MRHLAGRSCFGGGIRARCGQKRKLHKGGSVGCLPCPRGAAINSCASSTVSLLSPSLTGLGRETRSSGPAFSEGRLWDEGARHRPLGNGECGVVLIRERGFSNPEAVLASVAQESKL